VFNQLDSNNYEVSPITFKYVHEGRDFLSSPNVETFNHYPALSSVCDFNTNFNSINFLTTQKSKFDNEPINQNFAIYESSLPNKYCIDESEVVNNYWITAPQQVDGCEFCLNFTKLKNQYTENQTIPCNFTR